MDGRPLRVANCSGFFGDRLAAAREMIDGGPIDVLTGDWLAELTMGVLLKQRQRDPSRGWARTFLTQMEDVLADCLDRGIRIVSNAGGLNPQGCAEAVEELSARLGLDVRVAYVNGDDATTVVSQRLAEGGDLPHLDTDAPLADTSEIEVANAYLGCWGIAEALEAGADVVVTGRVSDASLIAGPAAWHFGWGPTQLDELAGAVVAGHVIECGPQATGGNYSFFTELDGLEHAGFPIAEIAADGSSIITKHPRTGGAVTVETVTAQLLYEIDGPRYLNPDVTARFDTVELHQVGPDRVAISGVRGEPAPATYKIGVLCAGGWRNSVTFVLTGLEIRAKAALAEDAVWSNIAGGRSAFDEVEVRLLRADEPDPSAFTEAVALLTISVIGQDRRIVDRFSRAAVETGLASYPGLCLTAPPGRATQFIVFWPTALARDVFTPTVTMNGRTRQVATNVSSGASSRTLPAVPDAPVGNQSGGPHRTVPLGSIVGARSGDKAGNATLGLWCRDDASSAWLAGWLTTDRLRELVPEASHLEVRPWYLPNIRSIGFTVVGFLGRGVSANLALDAQGKALGEYLRARWVPVPVDLLGSN